MAVLCGVKEGSCGMGVTSGWGAVVVQVKGSTGNPTRMGSSTLGTFPLDWKSVSANVLHLGFAHQTTGPMVESLFGSIRPPSQVRTQKLLYTANECRTQLWLKDAKQNYT